MDFKLITDTENPLFNRREIEGEIHSDVTPSREEVLSLLSKNLSVDSGVIKIRTIKGKFGQKIFLIVANIYKSKEDKEKIEHQKKKDVELEKRLAEKKAEAEKPKVEEKKEEVVESKSAGEKKEEPKVEEAKEEVVEEKIKEASSEGKKEEKDSDKKKEAKE